MESWTSIGELGRAGGVFLLQAIRAEQQKLLEKQKQQRYSLAELPNAIQALLKDDAVSAFLQSWTSVLNSYRNTVGRKAALESNFEADRIEERYTIGGDRYGCSFWHDELTPQWLRKNNNASPYKMNLRDTKWWGMHWGVVSNRLEGSVLQTIENVLPAKVDQATGPSWWVSYQGEWDLYNAIGAAYKFPVLDDPPKEDIRRRWQVLLGYAARTQAKIKALVPVWKDETERKSQADAYCKLTNTITTSFAALKATQPMIERIKAAFLTDLNSITQDLSTAVLNLSSDILAGDTSSFPDDCTKLVIWSTNNLRLQMCNDREPGPYLNSWDSTVFYSSKLDWLHLPEHTLSSLEYNELREGVTGFTQSEQGLEWSVRFNKTFAGNPIVRTWITYLDIQQGCNIYLEALALNITPNSFTLKVNKVRKVPFQGNNKTTTYGIRAAYLAYEQSNRKIWSSHAEFVHDAYSGTYDYRRLPAADNPRIPMNLTSPARGQEFRFPEGAFDSPPAVMIALKKLNFWCEKIIRFDSFPEFVTREGFILQAGSWYDTLMDECSVEIIAIAQ
ncbi:hypothetical protein MMC30_003871 [Trapelia coarctata]|nr:hypothetical protein [Trapelia coarctata]